MSFAEAIAALRNLFKVSAELPLAAAVDEMRSFMSMEATGSLVRDVDALVAATGVLAAAARQPALAPVQPAPAAAPQTLSGATSGAKKAVLPPPPPGQRSILQLYPDAAKTTIAKEELKKQRVLALQNQVALPDVPGGAAAEARPKPTHNPRITAEKKSIKEHKIPP